MHWRSFLNPQILGKFHSPFNNEITVLESFGSKIVLVDNSEQSGGTIIPMWQETVKKIHRDYPDIQDVLILGLAGGTIINILRKYYPYSRVSAVEIDKVMIDIGKKYFNFAQLSNLQIINTDAFHYLNDCPVAFDLIVIDLYTGKFNPRKSRQIPFLKKIKKRLQKNGLVIFNSHYYDDSSEFNIFLDICRHVFDKVEVLVKYKFSRIIKLMS